MEKLGQLAALGSYDLIVVDTPPTRSALDFLDAPQRLSRFLDGRMVRILAVPARAGGRTYLRVLSAGVGAITNTLTRVLGAQLLRDLSMFVTALETMFGGFRERAEETYRLLKAPGTTFVVVATPEPDALREASYFVERLAEEAMPLAGVILNRVHPTHAPGLSAERALAAAETLLEPAAGGTPDRGGDGADAEDAALAAAVLRLHAERMTLVTREQRLCARFTDAHPTVPVLAVAAQSRDVHDLPALRRIGAELAGGPEHAHRAAGSARSATADRRR